jgi:hypothetical protein
MKRAFLALRVVVLFLLITPLVLMTSPAEVLAEGCRCGPVKTTPVVWGLGSTCSAAEANLYATLIALAEEDCSPDGACAQAVVIVKPCHIYQGQHRVDGYLRYQCVICI